MEMVRLYLIEVTTASAINKKKLQKKNKEFARLDLVEGTTASAIIKKKKSGSGSA
jgi:hypothetical protein